VFIVVFVLFVQERTEDGDGDGRPKEQAKVAQSEDLRRAPATATRKRNGQTGETRRRRCRSIVRPCVRLLQAREAQQQAVKTAMDQYKSKKQARVKHLVKRTRRGQPVMKGQIDLLLQKIQQQKGNDAKA
jgi:hypothetical protein